MFVEDRESYTFYMIFHSFDINAIIEPLSAPAGYSVLILAS